MHFCTSLSWRVLRLYLERDAWDDRSPQSIARIREAELVWREVLLRVRPHPGQFQQHMLPMDRIADTEGTGSLAPNINRYLMRAIAMDLLRSGEAIYTYAKLGRFIVLGFVHEPHMEHWRGTKVHASEGVVEPTRYVVPGALRGYLNEKVARMSEALNRMSEPQQAKVEQRFAETLTDTSKAMRSQRCRRDVEMFGNTAFAKGSGVVVKPD